jgi:protein-S-isoprenylcysteine O-methyltransferase Ste14
VAWAFAAVQVVLLAVLVLAPADDGWVASPAKASAARIPPWIGMVILVVGLTVLFMAKARWEEARLRQRYAGYSDDARRTPRFVPGWPFGADRDVAGGRGGDHP